MASAKFLTASLLVLLVSHHANAKCLGSKKTCEEFGETNIRQGICGVKSQCSIISRLWSEAKKQCEDAGAVLCTFDALFLHGGTYKHCLCRVPSQVRRCKCLGLVFY